MANSVSRRLPSITAARGDPGLERWIRRVLAAAPPKAKSLVVTVWGDSIAPHGGAVWLSGLIGLLAPFGINERLVRTSVYRLAQEGWLSARQDGRRSLYRLTSQGQRRFEHAYRRIYAPPATDPWDGDWFAKVLTRAAVLPVLPTCVGTRLTGRRR
jgi:phenylacetic acid degradation operon negative regulatory protein